MLICAPLGCEPGSAEPQIEPVPDGSDLAAVQAWLDSGAYLEWEHHDPLPSAAMPTPGGRVHLSPQLAASIRSGASNHPAGSVAVRELVDVNDPTIQIGWAMNHKLDPGPGGDAWFFYEVFSTELDAAPLVSERGAAGCVGCHSQGMDYVLSSLD